MPRGPERGEVHSQVNCAAHSGGSPEQAGERDEFLRSVFDGLSGGIAVLDAQGDILLVNQWWRSFAEVHGVPPAGTGEGRNYFRICDEVSGSSAGDAQVFAEGVRRVLSGELESYTQEYHWRQSPEGERWLIGRVTPLGGSGPGRVIVAHEDITERKQAERALLLSEARYHSIVDASPMGIHLYTLEEDGRLVFSGANEAADRILGVPNRQFIGKTIEEAFPTLAETEFPEKYRKIARKGGLWRTEYVAYEDDQISGIYDVHAFQTEPLRTAVLFFDITERKRTEEELRASEQKYRLLFDSADELVSVYDRDGVCQLMNRRVAALFGGKPEDFIGKSFRELHPKLGDEFTNRVRLAIDSGTTWEYEGEVPFPEGRRWLLSRVHPVPDAQGEFHTAQLISQDLTKRKQAEEQFETIFRMSLDLMCIADLDTATFLKVNPAFSQVLGYTAEELQGQSVFELMHPDDVAPTTELIERGLRAGEIVQHFENRYRAKNGEYHWLSWSSHPDPGNGLTYSIAHDITERRRSEAALRESEDRLRTVVQTMPIMIDAFDEEQNLIVWNRECERVTGYTAEEIVGNPRAMEMLYPDAEYRGHVMDSVRRMVDDFRGVEFVLTCKNGERREVSWSNLSATHPIAGWASWAIGVDVTEQKRAEEARAHLEEQYRQSQKMEAIGQLTGGVAHDFNNLLQVINGSADMALEDLEPGHPAQEPLAEVAKAGERAARLVSQLLMFSRRQIMRPERLDLNDVVTHILKMLGRVIGEHVQVQWRPAPHVPSIVADRSMVEQALMNLCVNARDAMPEGGILTIETSEISVNEEYCATHSWAGPGTYALLSVNDTGFGMDKETLDRIFEPFFTTKEVGKGTGLGLSTVYGIVKQHDGMLNVYSEPGKGSTFSLYWPIEGGEAKQEDGPAQMKNAGGSETILLAEDDEMVRNLAKTVLTRAGYTVLAAADGAEALAVFENEKDNIDLVILDVVMPTMGGREAYERMLASRPDLKAIFASGYSENAVHTGFVLDEGLTLVQKPFARHELLHAVREKLEG